MFYQRYYSSKIDELLQPNKVLVIYGPRQVGKTTLIDEYLQTTRYKYFKGTGEDRNLQDILESNNLQRITSAFAGYDLLVIDEAQTIQNVGLALKLIVDHIPNVRVIASGSSSFELSNKLGEPLTGRQKVITIFPISTLEYRSQFGPMESLSKKEEFLIYGSYPETLLCKNFDEKKEYLTLLRDSYLLKDILELENIKNSRKLADLLKLLAFQIGNEVSYNELSKSLGIAKQTVERYLDLLEKTFIIKKLSGFSRNLRKEVTKTSRYYFWDNGVRNAVINNFNDISLRNDVGMLWENYLYIERVKKQSYTKIFSNNYFWRTYDRKEIDLIEERDGKLFGYEIKWGAKRPKPPKLWMDTYENAEYKVITQENYLNFISYD